MFHLRTERNSDRLHAGRVRPGKKSSASERSSPPKGSHRVIRRKDMGRNVTLSIGALILIVIVVAFLF